MPSVFLPQSFHALVPLRKYICVDAPFSGDLKLDLQSCPSTDFRSAVLPSHTLCVFPGRLLQLYVVCRICPTPAPYSALVP